MTIFYSSNKNMVWVLTLEKSNYSNFIVDDLTILTLLVSPNHHLNTNVVLVIDYFIELIHPMVLWVFGYYQLWSRSFKLTKRVPAVPKNNHVWSSIRLSVGIKLIGGRGVKVVFLLDFLPFFLPSRRRTTLSKLFFLPNQRALI